MPNSGRPWGCAQTYDPGLGQLFVPSALVCNVVVPAVNYVILRYILSYSKYDCNGDSARDLLLFIISYTNQKGHLPVALEEVRTYFLPFTSPALLYLPSYPPHQLSPFLLIDQHYNEFSIANFRHSKWSLPGSGEGEYKVQGLTVQMLLVQRKGSCSNNFILYLLS